MSTAERIAVVVIEGKLHTMAALQGGGAEQVERAFRRLAQRHHPDHGGTAAEFRQLKQARDNVLGQLAHREAALRAAGAIGPSTKDPVQ